MRTWIGTHWSDLFTPTVIVQRGMATNWYSIHGYAEFVMKYSCNLSCFSSRESSQLRGSVFCPVALCTVLGTDRHVTRDARVWAEYHPVNIDNITAAIDALSHDDTLRVPPLTSPNRLAWSVPHDVVVIRRSDSYRQ